ncbi:MAG: PHP domain-containing protein, partial [Acidobacteriota bacterium]
MNRHKSSIAALVLLISATLSTFGQTRFRTPMRIPDIPGYKTLKCDFHIHTVFSDGAVWPDVRSEEAWREGLDAIAITDHIEYQPHKQDLPTNHGRSYEIAKSHGDMLSVNVISGSEITRDMPPGHLNAIFMTEIQEVETDDWRDAVRIARSQGAFIFWNHPGWTGQQPDGVARWYPEHQELVDGDMLHGIEVVNEREYYPEAHRWCIQKNLTMLSNSDVHNPANLDYEVRRGDHRPVTLVFSKDRRLSSIKEALFAHRTAVYSANMLIGDESFLRPIFTRSITIENP